MQAADQGAEVVARTVIGGRRCRDEEPSLEMKSVVTAARLDAEQVNTFSTTQLLILSDDLAHEAISVKSSLLFHLLHYMPAMSMVCFHVSLDLPPSIPLPVEACYWVAFIAFSTSRQR